MSNVTNLNTKTIGSQPGIYSQRNFTSACARTINSSISVLERPPSLVKNFNPFLSELVEKIDC